MVKYHFVETKFHKKITEMGIDKNIFIVGAPALENLDKYTKDFETTKRKYFPELDEKETIVSFTRNDCEFEKFKNLNILN